MATRTAGEAAPDRKGRRSRRELLAGAAAALGVLGAETLVRATPAQAGTDGDVVLGGYNTSSQPTKIDTSATAGVHAFEASASGIGFGVFATSTTGIGVHAANNTNGIDGN